MRSGAGLRVGAVSAAGGSGRGVVVVEHAASVAAARRQRRRSRAWRRRWLGVGGGGQRPRIYEHGVTGVLQEAARRPSDRRHRTGVAVIVCKRSRNRDLRLPHATRARWFVRPRRGGSCRIGMRCFHRRGARDGLVGATSRDSALQPPPPLSRLCRSELQNAAPISTAPIRPVKVSGMCMHAHEHDRRQRADRPEGAVFQVAVSLECRDTPASARE